MKVKSRKLITISLCQMMIALVNLRIIKVDAKIVEGCIESRLHLICTDAKVINISSVVLGDSKGCWRTNCCPKPNSCIANPNANHVNEVFSRCNGRQTCSVDVIAEGISCGSWGKWSNNDFERITYDCIDNRNSTTTHPPELTTTTTVTADNRTENIVITETYKTTETNTDIKMPTDETTSTEDEFMFSSGTFLAIAITITFVSMVIILMIFMILKKKKTWLKIEKEMELSNVRHSTGEAIYANEDQFQNGNLYSSSQSINRICNNQRSEISQYEQANTVPICRSVLQMTSTARTEFDNECLDADNAATNNRQMAMTQNFNYSDESSTNLTNPLQQTSPFVCPIAPCQSSRPTLQQYANVSYSDPISKCDEDVYKNIEETEQTHYLVSSLQYELARPALELRGNNIEEDHSESAFRSGKCESESNNLCGNAQQFDASFKDTGDQTVVDNDLYFYKP